MSLHVGRVAYLPVVISELRPIVKVCGAHKNDAVVGDEKLLHGQVSPVERARKEEEYTFE